MAAPADPPSLIRFGPFEADLHSGELRKNGTIIRLQQKPFQLLTVLLENPGRLVTREELRRRLWTSDTFVDFDNSLNTAITKLREALGDSAEDHHYIETLARRGYRLVATVDREEPAAVATVSSRRRVGVAATLGLFLVGIIIVVAIFGSNLRGRRKRLPGTVQAGQIRSLAVLPLENLTGDPGQDYFVDGTHDALITELAQIGSLRVISRTSVLRYKQTRASVPEIAQQLNVDAVIEGAVARSGRRVRITAQLIDARNDRHLWARSYERDLSDVVALQGQVAREIADAAKAELAPHERARLENPRRINPDAYDQFLRGVAASGGTRPEAFSEAIVHFDDAIRLEPDFALAHAAKALAYYQFSFVGRSAPKEFVPKAEAAARKALELDDSLADAHFVLGTILYRYHWDWAEAEKHYRRALELPRSFIRLGYGEFLSLTGRSQEALAEAQRGREWDPLSPGPAETMGAALLRAGLYDQAVAEYEAALEKRPTLPRLHYQIGRINVLRGSLNEGIAELEKAVELSDRNPRYVAYLGYAYAAAGKTNEARKILHDLITLSQQQYISPYGIALIHVGLRENEDALRWLARAEQAHAFEIAEVASDPRLEPLRSNPRFQDLRRRVGPPPTMLAARNGGK